jgi:hypothetical protein
MTHKFIGVEGEGIPGVPARDLTDEEYEEALARHGPGGVLAELYRDESAPSGTRRTVTPSAVDEPKAEEE